MNKLKELTWENHQKAERSEFARKLLSGMTPAEYYKYLYNQYLIYQCLESAVDLTGIESIARSDNINTDLEELEIIYMFGREPDLICPVVNEYAEHVKTLEQHGLLAHVYVRHFGDMYGGQIIRKRNPGSGHMYDFDDVENLKAQVRLMLDDSMADEANQCFNFAMQLFEELKG